MAKAKGNQRLQDAEPSGLWHQPALMNLVADLLMVLAVAALAWAGLTALQRLSIFPLRELVLTQQPVRLSADQLEHAARTTIVGNFFTVDLDAARGAFEKLPWVRKATVKRQWPDNLTVTLEEHQVAARWRHPDGENALVNTQGEIFVAELSAPGDNKVALPVLSGPTGSSAEILQRYGDFSTRLQEIGRQLQVVSLSPRHAWRLKLDDGVTIDLGREQERQPLDARLARFVAHYDNIKSRVGALRVADMRYPNGFALSGAERVILPAHTAAAGRKS